MAYRRGRPTQETLDNVSLPKRLGPFTAIFKEEDVPGKPGRKCKCGTILSVYNAGRVCNLCKRKRLLSDLQSMPQRRTI